MRLEGVKAPIKELMQTTIDYPGNPTPGQFTPEAINHAWGSFASMEWTHSKDFWQMALLHTFIEYPVGLTGADPTAPNSGPVKLTANAELIKQARRGHPRDALGASRPASKNGSQSDRLGVTPNSPRYFCCSSGGQFVTIDAISLSPLRFGNHY